MKIILILVAFILGYMVAKPIESDVFEDCIPMRNDAQMLNGYNLK